MFDFDTLVPRIGTEAEKYTALKRLFGRDDILPFWVADMEFAVAPVIREALANRVAHPVYGYTSIPASLIDSISKWNERRYGLRLDNHSVSLVPGVMAGVSAAVLAMTSQGDAIVVQTPLYPPLMQTVLQNKRRLIENKLVVVEGEYRIDFDALERSFQVHKPKILLFCSPHNPVGRVWRKDEVRRIVGLTRDYNVCLVSDEIHADVVFPPHTHYPALAHEEQVNSNSILLNSASKSFNVAGLNTAYALIPDSQLRKSFRQQLRRMNFHGVNLFGMIALETAYSKGEKWLDELLQYLLSNRKCITDTLNNELPELKYYTPEGTYLFWMDFNSLGMTAREIRERLINGARIGLNDGVTFSRDCEGFWRFNFAVPRSMLEEGLTRIIRAFQ